MYRKWITCSVCGKLVRRKDVAVTKDRVCRWCFLREYNRRYGETKQ